MEFVVLVLVVMVLAVYIRLCRLSNAVDRHHAELRRQIERLEKSLDEP